MNHWLARVTPTAAAADELLERMGTRFDVDPTVLAASPSVLVGTVSQIVDTLESRREQLGISYLQLDAGFPTPDLDAFAPVIETLAENLRSADDDLLVRTVRRGDSDPMPGSTIR